MAFKLREKDKCIFSIKFPKRKKPNKKLNHFKIESFLIKNFKKPFDYKLNLPTDDKKYLQYLKIICWNDQIQLYH